jgi:hypothetical protein
MKSAEYQGKLAEANDTWGRLTLANEEQMRLGMEY